MRIYDDEDDDDDDDDDAGEDDVPPGQKGMLIHPLVASHKVCLGLWPQLGTKNYDFIFSKQTLRKQNVYQANIWSEVERLNGWQLVGHFGAGNKIFHAGDEDHDLCHDADADDDDDDGEHVPGKETVSVSPKHGCVVSVAEL